MNKTLMHLTVRVCYTVRCKTRGRCYLCTQVTFGELGSGQSLPKSVSSRTLQRQSGSITVSQGRITHAAGIDGSAVHGGLQANEDGYGATETQTLERHMRA